jgi:hypothetical protein
MYALCSTAIEEFIQRWTLKYRSTIFSKGIKDKAIPATGRGGP